ncbi:DUF4097 family beta strand repeat-containing protein [Treponema pedis]|uniref:DUF4097 family beta strand repeat-containing protein n=1 Tax=Treponema pedis TaxID=409322 RepID=UPI0004037C7A|nr:DUF4097 family beta strand repeat-containing protein [Treponema pedis]
MNGKRKFKLYAFFLFLNIFKISVIYAQNGEDKTVTVHSEITNIEVTVSGIDVIIEPTEKSGISYKQELSEGSNLSAVKRGNSLRFTGFRPSSGTIFIYVPKDYLLESCRIQTSNSTVKVSGIKAVYFVVSGTLSRAEITGSMLKNVLIAYSSGSIIFNSQIVAVADFCLSSSKGSISIAEKIENCNVFITQNKNESFTFNGEVYGKNSLMLSPQKPKKFITVSANFSNLAVEFVEPSSALVEKFDKYGISEFGPKRPPLKVNELSNFLPKN